MSNEYILMVFIAYLLHYGPFLDLLSKTLINTHAGIMLPYDFKLELVYK